MENFENKPIKTNEEILQMTGKVNFPPYEGWHPAGTDPKYQHKPTLSLEGMVFDEPLDENNCIVLNGTKFRVVWDESKEVKDDSSFSTEARFELAE